MKVRRFWAGILAGSLLMMGTPGTARADVYTASCLMSVTFTFVGTISTSSGPRDFGISGSGTCALTLNGIGNEIRTLTLSAPGMTSDVSTCAAIVAADTTYSANFSPAPSPAGSPGGPISFKGSASGGVLTLSPFTLFKGVATLAATNSQTCATTGKTSISYVGVLEILDP